MPVLVDYETPQSSTTSLKEGDICRNFLRFIEGCPTEGCLDAQH